MIDTCVDTLVLVESDDVNIVQTYLINVLFQVMESSTTLVK